MRHRRAQIALFTVMWALLLLAGALPLWQRSGRNDERITAVSQQISSLSEWSAAGVWLQESNEQWEPTLGETYIRLFPLEKDREGLFLELARVAKESGIIGLNVRVTMEDWDQGDEDEEWGTTDMEEDEGGLMLQELGLDSGDLPGSDIVEHRVRASFEGDYEQIVKFLAGLDGISRAVNVASLHAEPARRGVSVEMELDFYAQELD